MDIDTLSNSEKAYLRDLLAEEEKKLKKYYIPGAEKTDLITANYGPLIATIRSIRRKLWLDFVNLR